MSRYQPYPSYKDSGVEWLGEIPEQWRVSKIGFLSSKIGSGKTPRGGSEVYADEGIIFIRSQNVYDEGLRLDDVVFISKEIDEEMANTRVKAGDILLNVTGASIGRTTLVPHDFNVANVNQHVCIIRISSIEMRPYIALVMKSATAKTQIDAFQNGAAREGLNFEQIANIQIALPPISEQAAIANFLDMQTAKIDTLIAKQQRMIELLGEKRSTMISHAVTKGLNPNVAMKDSGVEWLGDVPQHWNRTRLGYIAEESSNSFVDGPFGSDLKSEEYIDEGIPLIQLNNIKEGEHILKNMKFISEQKKEQLSRHIARPSDIVIAKMADPVARATMVNDTYDEYVIVADCVRLTPDIKKINLSYLIYSINSKNVRTGAEIVSTGTTRIRINLTELKKLWIPYPPIIEQATIADYLDTQTTKIDTLIAKARQAIALMKERRTALISAAVTGKIDVRGMAL